MKRKYRVMLPLTVHTEDGAYTQGEVFEKEFTPEEEYENLTYPPGAPLLELVSEQEYEVTGESVVLDHAPGMTLTYAMPMVQEQRLIEGGAIALAKPKRKPKADKGE